MQTPLTEKQQFWLSHVQACDESGQSMRAYADANGLSVTALYNWKSVLRGKGALDAPVRSSGKLFRQAAVIGGVRAQGAGGLQRGLLWDFDGGPEPAWIADLVRALSA